MPSVLKSALENLDDSVLRLWAQLDRLSAGLEAEGDDVQRAIESALRSAAAVRDVVLAEKPEASWRSREDLELLVSQLETEAAEKVFRQRRDRIRELADELEVGTLKHRFQTRLAALEALRQDAVRELRLEATVARQEKDLPGPDVQEWVRWACALCEETEADALAAMRANFPSLERFAMEMEESYWVPGERVREGALTSAPAVRGGDRVGTGGPASQEVAVPLDSTATPNAVLAVAPAVAEPVATAGNQAQPRSNSATAETLSEENAVAGAADRSSEPASEPDLNSSRPDVLPSFDVVSSSSKPVTVWVTAGVVLLALAALAAARHFRSRGTAKPSEVAAASPATSPMASPGNTASELTAASGSLAATTERSSDGSPASAAAAPLLHKQPVEGAQHDIVLNLESCGRVPAGDVECWGYVTNVGNEASRVSLASADIVDGKGNSFNVSGNGKLAFTTGRISNIPAGSRTKYSVRVPDRDTGAKTLTLYVDLNNPNSSEFTFRDIPINE